MSAITREDMIKEIYRKVAYKRATINVQYYAFSDWVKVFGVCDGFDTGVVHLTNVSWKQFIVPKENVIGSPVMLWDVLGRIEGKLEDNHFLNFYIEDLIMDICNKRKYKRKPIDDQDEDCVSLVYSLIKYQWQN